MKDKDYFLRKAQENFPEQKFSVLTPDITEFIGSNGDSILLDLGTLSKTWLQEEVINLDFPQKITRFQQNLNKR